METTGTVSYMQFCRHQRVLDEPTNMYSLLVPSLAAVRRYLSGLKNMIAVMLRECSFDWYDNSTPSTRLNTCTTKSLVPEETQTCRCFSWQSCILLPSCHPSTAGT